MAAVPPRGTEAGPASLPNPFGPYRILEPLGKGGMGTVYLALDTRLGRRVAVKVCHLEGTLALERFRREARAAAALRHPNLCPLYECDICQGISYLTMAYIEGPTLAARLADHGAFPQTEAIRIVWRLALAMHYAHSHGVIHRDLKPANVAFDQHGEPVILDFGLARLAEASTLLTGPGAVVGTPAYMAPEQMTGDSAAIGPACDVYSLAVILFELLTGQRPFSGPLAAIYAQILHADRPSPLVLRPDLDERLATVCATGMARNPGDRYASMEAFATALDTILLALVPPPRQPASTPGNAAAPSIQETLNAPPRQATSVGDTAAGTESTFRTRRLEEPSSEPGHAQTASLPWHEAGGLKPWRRPRWRGVAAIVILVAGAAIWYVAHHGPSQRPSGPGETVPDEVRIFQGHTDRVVAVAFSPDGRLALSGSWDGSARLWDVTNGEEIRRWTNQGPVVSVAFSDDGHHAAYGLGLGQERVRLLNPSGPEAIRYYRGHVGYVFALLFTPGGESLFSGGGDSAVFQNPLDAVSKPVQYPGTVPARWIEKGQVLRGGWIRALGYSRSENILLAVHGDSTVQRWWGEKLVGEPFRLVEETTSSAAFSPDGRQLLLGSDDGTFGLWDIATRREIAHFSGHTGAVTSLAFSRDGERVLSGGNDGTMRLWNAPSGQELHCYRGHKDTVLRVAFSWDERFALSGSADNTMREWHVRK